MPLPLRTFCRLTVFSCLICGLAEVCNHRRPVGFLKEARDEALKTGMKEGVNQSFDRLAEYLATTA